MGWDWCSKPWSGSLPAMSPLPPLALGATVKHRGSDTVCIRTLLNEYIPRFKRTHVPGYDILVRATSQVTGGGKSGESGESNERARVSDTPDSPDCNSPAHLLTVYVLQYL